MAILATFFSQRGNSLFKIFSLTHIVTLLVIVLITTLSLFVIKEINYQTKKIIQGILGFFGLFLQIVYIVWLVYNNNFSIKESLPLNICSITLILVFFLFITENKIIFNLQYFLGYVEVFTLYFS